ncbi:MAG: MgtC/SapB family protein [Candidatus Eremiobacteraeota bacterium]|nr:MgtC/SapB family protein [Candidatus Eremiobacteraeota bacterium]
MNGLEHVDLTTVAGMIGNLLVASVLGGAIGAQRQATHKPAGFRTHLLVALGSCAFMEVSQLTHDVRIGAGVITGIGFLGAGSIVRAGVVPRGLTTAASIWSVAAVGISLALGTPLAYVLALTTTVLVFVALSFTDKRLDTLFPPRNVASVALTFDLDATSLDDVYDLARAAGVHVKRSTTLTIARTDAVRTARWTLVLRAKHSAALERALVTLSESAAIRTVEAIPSAEL